MKLELLYDLLLNELNTRCRPFKQNIACLLKQINGPGTGINGYGPNFSGIGMGKFSLNGNGTEIECLNKTIRDRLFKKSRSIWLRSNKERNGIILVQRVDR